MSEKWYDLIDGKKPPSQLQEGWVCPFCGMARDRDFGPDPCLGELPGVDYACCGHGGMIEGERGYIAFSNGKVIRFGYEGRVDKVTI